MKRAGFTIVELVIAISIFSIMIVYMYKAVASTKKSNTIYESKYTQVKSHEKLKKVIYNDIFNQVDPYKDLKFNKGVLYLRTKNSLHTLIDPYVAYKIKDKRLLRLESLKKITFPMNTAKEPPVFEVDVFASNIEDFQVSVVKNSYLFSWLQEKKQTLFEIKLPYSKKVILVQSETNSTRK